MNGLQVPTWIGALLVLAAPIGTVLGAWLGHRAAARTAAKRDDERWERELQREEIRAKRDEEKEERTRAHDLQVHWSIERRSAYSKLLAALDLWSEEFCSDIANWEQGEKVEHSKDAREARKLVRETQAEFDLVASLESSEAADRTIKLLIDVLINATKAHENGAMVDPFSPWLRCEGLLEKLRDVLRVDLGVADHVPESEVIGDIYADPELER